jgi:hypothetical protein
MGFLPDRDFLRKSREGGLVTARNGDGNSHDGFCRQREEPICRELFDLRDGK